MLNVLKKPPGSSSNGSGRGMQRLQFELALDLAGPGDRPLSETLARAAETVGADLLFVLPATDERGEIAIVRLDDHGGDAFLQVEAQEGGFAVSDEAQMDETLLALARASVSVFGQILDDDEVLETLAA